eukprot:COSAG02_NODE_15788_length_1141_cov_0.910749_2_plen_233_part_01
MSVHTHARTHARTHAHTHTSPAHAFTQAPNAALGLLKATLASLPALAALFVAVNCTFCGFGATHDPPCPGGAAGGDRSAARVGHTTWQDIYIESPFPLQRRGLWLVPSTCTPSTYHSVDGHTLQCSWTCIARVYKTSNLVLCSGYLREQENNSEHMCACIVVLHRYDFWNRARAPAGGCETHAVRPGIQRQRRRGTLKHTCTLITTHHVPQTSWAHTDAGQLPKVTGHSSTGS